MFQTQLGNGVTRFSGISFPGFIVINHISNLQCAFPLTSKQKGHPDKDAIDTVENTVSVFLI